MVDVNNANLKSIDASNCIKIIAEIGINHNGSYDVAKELIKASAKCGVDAIKFQYRNLSRCYGVLKNEIGDEILSDHINKSYLSPSQILELTTYAKGLGLIVGISFFIESDIQDFSTEIKKFDFFKVPSPEFDNVDLIKALLLLNKKVFISTGARNEDLICSVLEKIKFGDWNIFHCISNYPTQIFNAKLGYIKYLKRKWGREVGYSSHDESWATSLAAMTQGVKWIERHITLDKEMDGLDHSTSSTPDEFSLIVQYAKYTNQMLEGDSPRRANQGELMNLQNLGRSFYFSERVKEGDILKLTNLEYRSPATGIGMASIDSFLGKKLLQVVDAGDALVPSMFVCPPALSLNTLNYANKNRLTLPARFHDLRKLRKSLPTGNYELHLSYSELSAKINFDLFNAAERYSIHLPDYISSTEIMNPFSSNEIVRDESLKIIKNGFLLAEYLHSLTGHVVPIVASFSVIDTNLDDFYMNCKTLSDSLSNEKHFLTMQILPPFAWYFGGSVPITPFSSWHGWEKIVEHKIPITLDLSHLIMSCNYYSYSLVKAIDLLMPFAKHLHLSLADGVDGEGIDFRGVTPSLQNVISNMLDQQDCMKVIEVWQGHLDGFQGFRSALEDLQAISQK
jgi:N-acetylneuraminate synthase